jgi:hypothetical protein
MLRSTRLFQIVRSLSSFAGRCAFAKRAEGAKSMKWKTPHFHHNATQLRIRAAALSMCEAHKIPGRQCELRGRSNAGRCHPFGAAKGTQV